jgi:hypothetical protein
MVANNVHELWKFSEVLGISPEFQKLLEIFLYQVFLRVFEIFGSFKDKFKEFISGILEIFKKIMSF